MSFWVPVALALTFVSMQQIGTEFVAWRLHFNPSLGRAAFHVLYWPWDWVRWVFMFVHPLERMMGRAYPVYPSVVYDVLWQLPYAIAAGFVVSIVAAALLTTRPDNQNVDNLYDSGSKWADEKMAKADGLLNGLCGPIIGAFEVGFGRLVPLRYGGQLGLSYVEPPGGGKSAFLNTNLLIPLRHSKASKWKEKERRINPWGEEPVKIISDPKFELFKQTSGYQSTVLGADVYLLAPLGVGADVRVESADISCYNPLWNARIGTDSGFQDCYARTLAIVDPEGEGLKSHWDRTGLAWGAAVLEKLAYRSINMGDYEMFSLPGLLEYMSSFSSMDALLNDMLTAQDDPTGVFEWHVLKADGTYGLTRVKPSIESATREMLAKDPKERSGVFSTFIAFLAPYRSEILRRFITKSTFDWSKMANNRKKSATVYIAMDPMDIPTLRPYLRQVFGAAVGELTSGGTLDVGGRSARGNYRPVVMAMDEVAAFKKLSEIEHGSGYFRGYGIMLWLIWQSVMQQQKHYGKDNVLNETMDVLLYGRPKMPEGAKIISDALGETTHMVSKRSVAGGRFALVAGQAQDSIDPMKLPVMSFKNILQIPKDCYICFYNGHNYFLKKFEYFKNKVLTARAKIPHVRASTVDPMFEPMYVQSAVSQLSDEQQARWQKEIRDRRAKRIQQEAAGADDGSMEQRDVVDETPRTSSTVQSVASDDPVLDMFKKVAPPKPAAGGASMRSIPIRASSPYEAYTAAMRVIQAEREAAAVAMPAAAGYAVDDAANLVRA